MEATFNVSLSVMQYIFLFKKDVVCVTNSCAIILPFLLEYYEAKRQMLSVFSWKRYVKIQIFLFLKARS